MNQNLSQTQHQRQTLNLSQSQRQSLNLLHLPVAELQTAVNEEIAQNPVLDSEPQEGVLLPKLSEDSDDWLEQLLAMREENRFIGGGHQAVSPEEEAKRQLFLESVTDEVSFTRHLLNQIQFLGLSETVQSACEAVISALDDDGYLKTPIQDLCMIANLPQTVLEQAVQTVRELDPPGVAAHDIRDRLLMQLERQGKADTLTYKAVRDYLSDIGTNKLPKVMQKLNITSDEMNQIVGEIQHLHPRLEFDTAVSPHEYISEEAEVTENAEGSFSVTVRHDRLPPLYINRHYLDMLKDTSLPKEVHDYIKEKLKSGTGLINGILQRQSTIKRVVSAIVSAQEDFFRYGESRLKPLTMSEVAVSCGVHESTVSRTVAGKFLRCRFGLYPIRAFFTSGVQVNSMSDSPSENSDSTVSESVLETLSNDVVKNKIKTLIDAENHLKPLSDAKLTELLNAAGFTIARRTVAKYREQLNILPTHLRRQF